MLNPEALIRAALEEDITDPSGRLPSGDHTSLACIPEEHSGTAVIYAKEAGILAGLSTALSVFQMVDGELKLEPMTEDGARLEYGTEVLRIEGSGRSLLRAERVALNFMQRMSGTASLTRKFVDAVEGTGTKILDTRKTTPNFRPFQKEAVRLGGGTNHRYGLFDMVMIKDNHIDLAGGITEAVRRVLEYQDQIELKIPIEVETRSLADVDEVLSISGIDRVMLDNFSTEEVALAIKKIAGSIETEVSGNITLETVRSYAEQRPDYISSGALTHSAGCLDLSMKINL